MQSNARKNGLNTVLLTFTLHSYFLCIGFSHISVTGKHLPKHTGQTVGKVWTYSRYSCKVRR